MTFLVHVLQSELTGRLYVGQTSDLERRLREHKDEDFGLPSSGYRPKAEPGGAGARHGPYVQPRPTPDRLPKNGADAPQGPAHGELLTFHDPDTRLPASCPRCCAAGELTGWRGSTPCLRATHRQVLAPSLGPPQLSFGRIRLRRTATGPNPGESKGLPSACAKRGACLCVARRQAAGRQAAPRDATTL